MADKKTKIFLSKWGFITLQVVIVLLAIAVGVFGYQFYQEQQGELALLHRAKEILKQNTIYEIPSDQELEYGMIRGMLNSLEDPFARFVPPADHEVQTDQLQGEFGGIGARLERDTQNRWRLYPLPDSPAFEAGIKDGDILLSVDGQVISTETDEINLLSLLRGPVGKKVKLTVQREDEERSFTIKRQQINLPSVASNTVPEDSRIGLIQVVRIAETTASEIEDGVQELQSKGVQALVLDLRNNGGGLVEAGVNISRLFLSEGEIMRRQFRDEDVTVFEVEDPGPFAEVPVVILVNGNTASSAEIVAGALVKHERASLIGMPTYGKTSIQYIFDLQDGSSLHVTSGRWWVPGVDFPLQPGYTLAQDASESAFIQKAIEVLANHLQ